VSKKKSLEIDKLIPHTCKLSIKVIILGGI